MKRTFVFLGLLAAVALFAGCASSGSNASTVDDSGPSTTSPVPRGNPLDTPDESTLPHVPGQ